MASASVVDSSFPQNRTYELGTSQTSITGTGTTLSGDGLRAGIQSSENYFRLVERAEDVVFKIYVAKRWEHEGGDGPRGDRLGASAGSFLEKAVKAVYLAPIEGRQVFELEGRNFTSPELYLCAAAAADKARTAAFTEFLNKEYRFGFSFDGIEARLENAYRNAGNGSVSAGEKILDAIQQAAGTKAIEQVCRDFVELYNPTKGGATFEDNLVRAQNNANSGQQAIYEKVDSIRANRLLDAVREKEQFGKLVSKAEDSVIDKFCTASDKESLRDHRDDLIRRAGHNDFRAAHSEVKLAESWGRREFECLGRTFRSPELYLLSVAASDASRERAAEQFFAAEPNIKTDYLRAREHALRIAGNGSLAAGEQLLEQKLNEASLAAMDRERADFIRKYNPKRRGQSAQEVLDNAEIAANTL